MNTSSAKQLIRFLIVGCTAVGVDFLCYLSCLACNIPASTSKTIGFLMGTFFTYHANRIWTFEARKSNRSRVIPFLVVYAFTLAVNVAVNSIVLHLLSDWRFAIYIAFVIAAWASAILNFIGMKFFVFRRT